MIGKTAFGAANLGSLLHKTAASVSTDFTLDKRSLRLQVLPWLMLDVDADKGQLRPPKPHYESPHLSIKPTSQAATCSITCSAALQSLVSL